MFFKSGHRKSSNPILAIFRLMMSLVIIAILGLGLLQAYKAFSGYDPLKLDSESLKNLMSSDSSGDIFSKLLSLNPQSSLNDAGSVLEGEVVGETKSAAPVKFKFAVVADSHKDTANLQKALAQAQQEGVKFVIIMGDLSDVGTIEELTATKNVLDASGLTYYVAAGDHDLWD